MTRLPAAFKHGAFAAVALLPWEDPGAYAQLGRDLHEELEPEGALQQECVQDILMATWRKRRLRERRNVETRAVLLEPQNRVFDQRPDSLVSSNPTSESASRPCDDYERLLQFSASLTLNSDPKFVELEIGLLPEEYKTHLQTHLPQRKFEAAYLWIMALKKELDGVLLPRVRERRPDPDGYLPAAAELLAPRNMLEDLAIEERLEAQIDRALRRLFWLKTQKKLDWQSKQKFVDANVS
jgi:hypothetical protein